MLLQIDKKKPKFTKWALLQSVKEASNYNLIDRSQQCRDLRSYRNGECENKSKRERGVSWVTCSSLTGDKYDFIRIKLLTTAQLLLLLNYYRTWSNHFPVFQWLVTLKKIINDKMKN
jgi:hypothetical protein